MMTAYWYLGGKCYQNDVPAESVVVCCPTTVAMTPLVPPLPVPLPVPARRVKIRAASYSFGSDYADVTERVRKLVRAGTTFQANPGWLHADPHPYWNKALVIVCKINHRTAIYSVGENENVSRDLLFEKSTARHGQSGCARRRSASVICGQSGRAANGCSRANTGSG